MSRLGVILIFMLMNFSAFAQSYQNELKGSFKLAPTDPDMIQYVLKWSEENGAIKGLYSDNYFSAAAPVEGMVKGNRTFFVDFRSGKKGVDSLLIMTNSDNAKNALPVVTNVITRDLSGNPLSTIKTTSTFNKIPDTLAQNQEENCAEEFGLLAGYCGIYAGVLTEEQDRRNKCNLLFADAARIELRNDSTVLLHLGDVNQIVNTSGHTIGRLPVSPQSRTVDLMSRICGPLTGVNSSVDSCKRVHLNGEFSVQGDRKHFKGSYTISEEGTNNICLYTLSMDQ